MQQSKEEKSQDQKNSYSQMENKRSMNQGQPSSSIRNVKNNKDLDEYDPDQQEQSDLFYGPDNFGNQSMNPQLINNININVQQNDKLEKITQLTNSK